jgi:hypothetical protein
MGQPSLRKILRNAKQEQPRIHAGHHGTEWRRRRFFGRPWWVEPILITPRTSFKDWEAGVTEILREDQIVYWEGAEEPEDPTWEDASFY